MSTSKPSAARPLSLGVIFLTLYIDLIGFSIIFPLGPDLLTHYLSVDGHNGILGWLLTQSDAVARALGKDTNFAVVLFGGVVTSVFSTLQLIFAPLWGTISDRRGRRGVLLVTVAGTAVGYALWAISGSFWLFLVSRVVSGAFGGNLSVATAAVADVTSRAERSRAMGLVGAAFGLGFITGPAIGSLAARYNLLESHPSLARFGINPFSVPALFSLGLCLANVVWVAMSFKETLSPEALAAAAEPRLRNPIRAILGLENPSIRRANVVAFIYSIAFVAMESSLTFLAAQRFGYTAQEMWKPFVFLGFFSIFTQGYIVRKLLKTVDEIRVLALGLLLSAISLLLIGLAQSQWEMYAGLALTATGAGLVNPATTGLISLYASASEQGRVLGIFRSLGSLSRAITPLLAGTVFWVLNSTSVFVGGAILAIVAWSMSVSLPKPAR